ncbi:MAG: hypothetical protein R3B13_14875 [Polyangiaceae bacterium]
MNSSSLHARLDAMRARRSILRWEFRQRNLAKGVWFRLRRRLADAERVFVITPESAAQLIGEGIEPLAVGQQLQPPLNLFVLSGDRAVRLAEAREIAVRLSAELLTARNLVLVPFSGESRRSDDR